MGWVDHLPPFEPVKRWAIHIDDQREAEGHKAPWRDGGWQDWAHNSRKEGTQVIMTYSEEVDGMSDTLWRRRMA
jgi:hypothetical protein